MKHAKPTLITPMAQMLAYFQLFSMVQETEELKRKPPCTVSVETLQTYAQAEYRTRVTEVKGQSLLLSQPCTHIIVDMYQIMNVM